MFKSRKDSIFAVLAPAVVVLSIVLIILFCVKLGVDGTLVKPIIDLKVWELGLTVFIGCFLANLFT